MSSLTDIEIREIFLANGFVIKPGQVDLKPYVYAAARAIERRIAGDLTRAMAAVVFDLQIAVREMADALGVEPPAIGDDHE